MLTRLLSLLSLGLVALLVGCGSSTPGQEEVRSVVEERLVQAFPEPVLQLTSLRRLGSGPLSAAADGSARRLAYYNATLTFARDFDFSSWQSLNLAAFANLLGATEKGISGLKQGGNKQGDVLHVHGSVAFVNMAGSWQPQAAVRTAVAAPPPENNTGPPAVARQIIEGIQALFADTGQDQARRDIITEELEGAYDRMQLRLDRLGRAFVVAGGPEGGEYQGVALLIADRLADTGVTTRAVVTAGSVENVGHLHDRRADAALVQNDIAALAGAAQGPFASGPPLAELRALASLFPEPVHIVVAADSPIASLADLRGKRVEIGLPDSGTRLDALAVLKAADIGLDQLTATSEVGLVPGLRALADGTVDAVIATISAPSRRIQELAAGPGVRLVPLSETEQSRLIAAQPAFVAVTLPPATYAGQTEPVRTVSVTALLAARADLPDNEVETLLRTVFDDIDFLAVGSAAGSLIARATARTGVTIPWHPAAEKFLGTPTTQ